MNKIRLDEHELNRWRNDNGDLTHNINYNLSDNSVIMDFGGYKGVWANTMIGVYNPNVYILEPIPEFIDILEDKFKNNPKVKILGVGVSTENKDDIIYVSGDGSSSNTNDGSPISVKFKKVESILEELNLDKIDLVQINIEGDEYNLMEYMLENKLVNHFKNIQIQFHLGVFNDKERRSKIHDGLALNGFKIRYEYPFVWESWYKI